MGAWYQEDPNKHPLGLMSLWDNKLRRLTRCTENYLQTKAVMEVNGVDGSFTSRTSRSKSPLTVLQLETSNQDFPG
jgi:hypothetical protein